MSRNAEAGPSRLGRSGRWPTGTDFKFCVDPFGVSSSEDIGALLDLNSIANDRLVDAPQATHILLDPALPVTPDALAIYRLFGKHVVSFDWAITSHRKNATEPEGSYAIVGTGTADAQEVKEEEAESAPVRELTPAPAPLVNEVALRAEAAVAAAIAAGPIQTSEDGLTCPACHQRLDSDTGWASFPFTEPRQMARVLPVQSTLRVVLIGSAGRGEGVVRATTTMRQLIERHATKLALAPSVARRLRLQTEDGRVIPDMLEVGDLRTDGEIVLTVVGPDDPSEAQVAANKAAAAQRDVRLLGGTAAASGGGSAAQARKKRKQDARREADQ